ncbi:hypothetical protein [Chitinibacter sp. GC72]|uniref:hypothetical protein n=1 Tax=Chitinibacter sp. GC72 TaxID=1526917 RepID=UPI0012FBCA45|nr:hypothetical protein [Chitinibacter sp. GC72]
MSNLRKIVAVLASSPWLALLTGLTIALLGAIDLLETRRGVVEATTTGELALVLTGAQQVFIGLINLIAGSRLLGVGLLGTPTTARHPAMQGLFKGYVENPKLNLFLSLSMLLLVGYQGWQDWVLGGLGQARSVWYFGLGLIALLAFARSLSSLILALGLLSDAEQRGRFSIWLADCLYEQLQKPWLLLSVAAVCLLLGMAEELFFVVSQAGTAQFIAHYGMLLFVLLEASKLLPILFPAAVLANKGMTASHLKSTDSTN